MKIFICLVALCCLIAVIPCSEAAEDSSVVVTAGLWEDMKEKAGSATEKVTEVMREKFSDAGETFAEVQDWTTEKAIEVLGNLARYKPIIEEAGFDINEVALEVGIIPALIVSFEQMEEIPAVKREELLKNAGDDRVLVFILQTLFKTYSLTFDTYRIKSTRLYLTIPPKTRVMLSSSSLEEAEESGDPQ